MVCFHLWQFSVTDDYIAIVSNGEIQIFELEYEDSQCTLKIEDLTAEDIGRHRCQQRPDVFSPHSSEYSQCLSFIAVWVDKEFISPD